MATEPLMITVNASINEDETEIRLEFGNGALQFTADELDEFIMALTEARSRMRLKAEVEPDSLN